MNHHPEHDPLGDLSAAEVAGMAEMICPASLLLSGPTSRWSLTAMSSG